MSPCLLAFAANAAEDADAAYAERILSKAKVATDSRGVMAFIRVHTLSEEELDRLERAVRLLGDDEFPQREEASRQLIAAGRPALPFLRPAVHDPDPEVVRRAKRCIEVIRRTPSSPLMGAAAQILKARRPHGAAAVLLAYLPCIDEPAVEETWLDALGVVGWQDNRPDPILLAALTEKRSMRRAAAAHVLGRAASGEVRELVRPLLTDRDARVRYEAAAALARFGDKAAMAKLTALLSDAPRPVAVQAEDLLSWLAEGKGPAIGLSNKPALRVQHRLAWESWWRKHAAEVDFESLKHEEPPRGRTVVCEYDGGNGGRIWEWGRDGKLRWEVPQLLGPNDVQILSGGRLLLAERNGNRLTERDHQGKILWEHRTGESHPIACQRLANGNTLVTTFYELYEVTIDQKKIFRYTHREGFRHAVQRPDGRIVFITGQGGIVELDAARKKTHSIPLTKYASGAGFWASIEPLSNGRYLVALGGANRVIEIDDSGKIHWEAIAHSAVFATRLRNGHTLVSCFSDYCVLELDRAGREVSKQKLRGRPFAVRRY